MFTKELSIFNEALNNFKKDQLSKGNSSAIEVFEDVFKDVNKIHKVENNYIYVIVNDILTKFKVDKFYSISLNEYVKSITNGELGLKFITLEDAKKEELSLAPSQDKEKIDPERSKRLLRPEFTFENFVVGESNRFAYTEAKQVANSPYASFNPLYIMGHVGLGKTHLMQAIGHYVLDNNMKANVIYTSSNQFTDDYFRATSTKNADDMIRLTQFYEDADLLSDDDFEEKEDGEPDFKHLKETVDTDELKEKYVDYLVNRIDDYVEAFKFEMGEDEFNYAVEQNNLIDKDALIDYCINTDGVGHNIATYDGKEIELGDGFFAYRTN